MHYRTRDHKGNVLEEGQVHVNGEEIAAPTGGSIEVAMFPENNVWLSVTFSEWGYLCFKENAVVTQRETMPCDPPENSSTLPTE